MCVAWLGEGRGASSVAAATLGAFSLLLHCTDEGTGFADSRACTETVYDRVISLSLKRD